VVVVVAEAVAAATKFFALWPTQEFPEIFVAALFIY
jgi:hypothetical protein